MGVEGIRAFVKKGAVVYEYVLRQREVDLGHQPTLPKVESVIGNARSPYVVTKLVNELYAAILARCNGLHSIGLRYYNVFRPRPGSNDAYAAVIPKWIGVMINGERSREAKADAFHGITMASVASK